MQDEKNENSPLVEELVDIISQPSHTDPNGSWTGAPLGAGEIPVQDADDL
ncbi:MAG: hypothetical protein Q4G07_07800 [Oscillospiraceae bacterium]|nr:hypothetical protein [Oscillospiraceae bacterium]